MKPIYEQYYYPPQQQYQQQQHPGYNTATPFMRRAFHDAIYEEEYGSESDEECCRGRGFSAVLCWFLSVIILIGLAASVVLTVFFILKSRSFLSKNNGELDVLYEGDGGNSLMYPPANDLNFDFPPDKHRSTEEEEEHLSTTTRAPPGRFTTRKNQNSNERKPAPTKESSLFNIFLDGMQKYENGDFPLTPSKESFLNFPNPHSEEILSNESQDRRTRIKVPSSVEPATSDTDEEEENFISTTTTRKPPPSQQVLFTIPPTSATTAQPPRRNIQTTRFPYGRPTTVTTTTTTKGTKAPSSKESKEDGNVSTNARYNPYGNFGRHEDEEEEEEETNQKFPTTGTTKDPEIDVYHSDEAQLKKMLLEEIPPHRDTESRNSNTNNVYQRRANSKERTSFTSPATTTTERPEEEPEDTLARIIKNLAPKWGREKPETTTTIPPQIVTSPSGSRYNVTMTSRDRSKSRESNEYNSAQFSSKENVSRQRFGRPSSTTKHAYVTPVRTSGTTMSPYNHDDLDDSTNEMVGSPKPTPYEYGKKVGNKRITTDRNDHPIKVIESPDLNKRGHSKETENNHQRYGSKETHDGEFLDILVGADAHKTLVTKQTADGIVTSAILPPWYDANDKNENISDIMKMNGTSPSIPEVKTMNESHSDEKEHEEKGSEEGENSSYPRSEFDLLLNLFSQSPLPKKGQNITSVSKKGQSNSNERIATIVTIKPKIMQADESIPNRRNTNTATRKTPNFKDLMKDLLPGLTSSGPISRSTQKPPAVNPKINKANPAFHLGSTDGSTDIYGYYPDEDNDSKYVQQHRIESEKLNEDLDEDDPIEEAPSHVIDVSYHPSTQPEIIIEPEDDSPYDSSGDQFSSGSSLHQSVLPPPNAEELPASGGGIRRPFSSEEEMEFGESDPKPSIINKNRTATTETSQVSPTASPENIEKSKEETVHETENTNENYSGNDANKSENQVNEEEEVEEDPEPTAQFEEEPLETEELKGTEKGILKVPTISNVSKEEENIGEESKISEELKPSPTRYDPRVNILKNRKRPLPKLEEKIRHPSIESFEDFKGSPVDTFGSPTDNSPVAVAKGSKESQFPAAGGASYEEYESEEPPLETRASEEEIKESNEVTQNDELNKSPEKIVSAQGLVKQPSYEELDEEDKYSQSTEDSVTPAPAEDNNRIHRVYSVSYDPSTTENPVDENKQTDSTKAPESSNSDDKNKGFIPPRPENFHENKYTFSPQIPDTGVFQSKDGWRPVVYDRNGNGQPSNSAFRNALTQTQTQNSNRFTTPSPQSSPPVFFSTAPLYSTLTGVPSPPPAPLVTPTPPLVITTEDYEEEEEDASYDDHNHQENGAQSQWPNNIAHSPQQNKLTIKPSQPIPSPPTPAQAKGHQEDHPQKPNQPQSTLQNQIIDRSKYMVRPAPPPIVMRRTPHANMPFLPPRPNRPQPATLPTKPSQFVHAPHPQQKHGQISEYPHPPHPINTNLPGRPGPGRFKQMSAGRPRSNIQWPTDDDRRTVFPANRRSG